MHGCFSVFTFIWRKPINFYLFRFLAAADKHRRLLFCASQAIVCDQSICYTFASIRATFAIQLFVLSMRKHNRCINVSLHRTPNIPYMFRLRSNRLTLDCDKSLYKLFIASWMVIR
jgi:hypothetical protein